LILSIPEAQMSLIFPLLFFFQLQKENYQLSGWHLSQSTSEDLQLPVTFGCLVSFFFGLVMFDDWMFGELAMNQRASGASKGL